VALTDAELRVMKALWQDEPATAQQLGDRLGATSNDSTVRTILRILEQKGFVRHEKEGRAYVYRSLARREQVQQSALRQLMRRFFDDSPRALVQNLLSADELSAAEVSEVRRLLDARKRGEG